MLDWLKPILGDAYTEEIDKKISEEIGKGFVARTDFNTLSATKKQLEEDVKKRDAQLDELSKAQGATDDLKKTIENLKQQNEDEKAKHEAEMTQIRLDHAVEAALTKAGARNNTAVKALLAEFLTDAKLADDGTVKGLQAEIDTLVKGEGTAFLFNTQQPQQQTIHGMQPGTPGGNPPPADGNTYAARLAEARKSGNTAAVIAIKREAAENGVNLM